MTQQHTHIAFLFPGQGSQTVGMLSQHALQSPLIEETFAQASAVLGYDLWHLTQTGPAETLNQTVVTQPALLTAGVALWRLWETQVNKTGLMPRFLAGHSLGEYTALVCAGALGFQDAVALVAERGRLMQAAVPEGAGAMAAIVGLDNEKVAELCKIHSLNDTQQVTPANYNAHGQVVIAGHTAAVESVVLAAKTSGAKLAKRLSMSVPSHCALMLPAAMGLKTYLAKVAIKPPLIPVINNVDVAILSEPDAIRDALVRQLYHPVQWVNTIEYMQSQGISIAIECGPGNILAGLVKRIVKDLQTITLETQVPIENAIALV